MQQLLIVFETYNQQQRRSIPAVVLGRVVYPTTYNHQDFNAVMQMLNRDGWTLDTLVPNNSNQTVNPYMPGYYMFALFKK